VPKGLWVSTGILAMLSACTETASRSFAIGDGPAFKRLFKASFILAIAFVLSQVMNWSELTSAHLGPKAKSLYAFSFYMLTGLHALHVLGGIVWHFMAMRKFSRGEGNHETVRNTAVYWHFLGVCWIALFGSLALGTNPDLSAEQIMTACWTLTSLGVLMFVVCWFRAIVAIAKYEGFALAVLGIIPMVAYLRAFMRADEMKMRGNLLWWSIWFGVILASVSVGFAIKFGPGA